MLEEAQARHDAAMLKQQAETARSQAESEYVQALAMEEGRMSEKEARAYASQLREDEGMRQRLAAAQGDPLDAAVSGWLLNHPYRTNVEALAGKFPGFGIAARTLYNTGLGK